MHYPYFDTYTIILYLFVGTICMLSMKMARGGIKYSYLKSLKGFFFLFATLLLFAVLRKVGLHLGGEDALNYQEIFLNYSQGAASRYENTDILFGIFTGAVRSITNEPIIYRLFCYGLITFGYVFFLKELCPQGISCIPFICILIPFMRSFGSMRNTMSIALFLLSIVAMFHQKTFLCILLICASILMHRLSFIMISFYPFYFLFKNLITKASKIKLILSILALICLSYLLSLQLQKIIIIFSLFDDNGNADFWYLTHGEGKNILLNWPMYLVHLLLFIALIIRYKSIPNTSQISFLKICFAYDIIMLPATLILGMWRFAEYFYISNLILWAILIPIICNKFSKESSLLIRGVFLLGFSGLLYIRLIREWEDLALMPYLFIWE